MSRQTRLARLDAEIQTLKKRSGMPLEVAEFLDKITTFRGVRLILKETVDLAASTPTTMLWTETGGFDHGGWFDAGSSESEIIIPRNVEHVEIHASANWESSNNGFRQMEIHRNGTAVSRILNHAGSNADIYGQFGGTGVIDATMGDIITVVMEHGANTNLEVLETSDLTWIAVHIA